MTFRAKVVRGLRAVGLSTASVAALKLVQLVVLARLLDPSAFGVMAMATVVLGLLAHLAELGPGAVVIHARSMSERDLNNLFWIGIVVALFSFLFVVATSAVLARQLSEPQLVPVLMIASLSLVAHPIGAPYRSLLERELAFEVVAKIEVWSVVAGVALAMLLALQNAGAMSLAWGLVATSITQAFCLVAAGSRRWKPKFSFSIDGVAKNLTFGAHLSGQRLVNFVTANADYVLVGSFLGSTALGLYTVAYNLANLPSSHVNALLARVGFPALSQISDDLNRTRSVYLKIQEASGLVSAPILLGLAAGAQYGVPVVLGDQWQPMVPVLQVLCVVGLGRAICGTIGPLLLARGRPDLGFRWSLLVLLLLVPALYLGLKIGGLLGVAAAFALVQTGVVGLNYVILVRSLLGPCLYDYSTAVLRPLALALGACLAMWIVGRLLNTNFGDTSILVAQIAVGSLAYGILVFWHRPQFLREALEIAGRPARE